MKKVKAVIRRRGGMMMSDGYGGRDICFGDGTRSRKNEIFR